MPEFATGAYRRRARLARQQPRMDPHEFDIQHAYEMWVQKWVFIFLSVAFIAGAVAVYRIAPSLKRMPPLEPAGADRGVLGALAARAHTFVFGTGIDEERLLAEKLRKKKAPAAQKRKELKKIEETKEAPPHPYQASYDRIRREIEEQYAARMRAEEGAAATTAIYSTNAADMGDTDGSSPLDPTPTSPGAQSTSSTPDLKIDGTGSSANGDVVSSSPHQSISSVGGSTTMGETTGASTASSTTEEGKDATTGEGASSGAAASSSSTTITTTPTGVLMTSGQALSTSSLPQPSSSSSPSGETSPTTNSQTSGSIPIDKYSTGTVSPREMYNGASVGSSSSEAESSKGPTTTTATTTTESPVITTTPLPLIGTITIGSSPHIDVPYEGVNGVGYSAASESVVKATVFAGCRMVIPMKLANGFSTTTYLDNRDGTEDMEYDVDLKDVAAFDSVRGGCNK